jgi:hypothetical protein
MKIKIISILSLAFLLSACSNWIDSSMNVSPNNPENVSVVQLVPSIEANLAYGVGGEIARFTCQWTQQLAGLQSQAADMDIYNISEADVNNDWSYYLYTPGMVNTKILIDKAIAAKSPWYQGIGEVLMAYQLGVATDLWGDVPYSDAFNGTKYQFQSKYDTQQQIYTTISTLLTSAITHLKSSTSVFKPSAEDLIYGGDVKKWIKTAYALQARYSIHLSKQIGNQAYIDALTAIANAYASNDDDLKYIYGSSYSNSNPNYQYQDQRPGYVAANSTFMDMLKAVADPRLSVYFAAVDTSTVKNVEKLAFLSTPAGVGNYASPISDAYASSSSPTYLMSYVELMFIKAEALFQTNSDKQLAADAYNEGLKACLQREGVYGDGTWYNANTLTASTITLQKIMNQKYLSGFLQMETYNDWRRTGYPVLTPAVGAVTTGSVIPRRFPYPQDERLYNKANMPAGLTILSRVWWDK